MERFPAARQGVDPRPTAELCPVWYRERIGGVSAHEIVSQLEAKAADTRSMGLFARDVLEKMKEENKEEIKEAQAECTRIEHDLLEATRALGDMCRDSREQQGKVRDLIGRVAAIESRWQSLTQTIHNLEGEIRRHNATIAREERRQSNAVYDLIPFHGIISAIVSGDGKRAIPFYSQIDGIVSAIVNDRDAASRRLNQAQAELHTVTRERDQAATALEQARRRKAELEQSILCCQACISSFEQQVASAGRRLTSAKDVQKALVHLSHRCRLLETSISILEELPDEHLARDCIDGFRRLVLN